MPNEAGHADAPYLFDLPTFEDERGQLTVAESGEAVPFDVERIYYLYDVPAEETRGEHAHLKLEQVMVAISGSLTVALEGQFGSERFRLDSPDRGLYVPKLSWRELTDFSADACCLVIASHRYDPDDYVHDKAAFREHVDRHESNVPSE